MKKLFLLAAAPLTLASCGLVGLPQNLDVSGSVLGTPPAGTLRLALVGANASGVVQDGSHSEVVISPAQVQPISGDDLAEALADIATSEPLNATVETAGPERFRLPELALEVLTAYEDSRRVIADPRAPYFGAELRDTSLLPRPPAPGAPQPVDAMLHDTLQPRAATARSQPAGWPA